MIDNHDKQTRTLEYCLRVSTFFLLFRLGMGTSLLGANILIHIME